MAMEETYEKHGKYTKIRQRKYAVETYNRRKQNNTVKLMNMIKRQCYSFSFHIHNYLKFSKYLQRNEIHFSLKNSANLPWTFIVQKNKKTKNIHTLLSVYVPEMRHFNYFHYLYSSDCCRHPFCHLPDFSGVVRSGLHQ